MRKDKFAGAKGIPSKWVIEIEYRCLEKTIHSFDSSHRLTVFAELQDEALGKFHKEIDAYKNDEISRLGLRSLIPISSPKIISCENHTRLD